MTTETATEPPVVRREPVPAEIRALSTMTGPVYADAFTMSAGVPGRSPEEWARALFEDVGGRGAQVIWRVFLGLRLTASPDRVAGWRIADRGDTWVRLEARSWFLTGHLVVQADDDHVTLATFVRYDRPLASRVWRPLSGCHRRLAPGLLRDARKVERPGRTG